MRWSFKVGTLFGIRIELHVTFLLFVGWIGIERGLLTGNPARGLAAMALLLMIFGCVLLHELGHALAARRYGIRTRDIILLPIGGLARLERMPDKPQQEIVVALAGPAVNVLLALVFYALSRGFHEATVLALRGDLIETLLAVNVLMLLFNLVPAFPMDGGRVLRAVLALKLPYSRATRIASHVGQAIALLFGVTGLFTHNVMLVFIALFVFLAASEERTMVETRASLEGFAVSNAMLTEFHVLDEHEPLQRAVDHLMAGSQQDFPVLRGGRPAGLLTRADLVRALQQFGANLPVGEAARFDEEYLDANEPLEPAIRRMRGQRRTALPVLHGGRLVGLLTLENVGDLLVVRDALRRYAGSKAVGAA